jgi:6-phosphogluconolactonase
VSDEARSSAPHIEVFADRDQLAVAAAERVTAVVEAAIEERGRCSVALAGGTTPRPVYCPLASPPFVTRIHWRYDLREHFASSTATSAGQQTCFDLVLLGLGGNGHTASIFPDQRAVRESGRWVLAEHIHELDAWRITLTSPAINAAREVLFLVSGDGKAKAVSRVLEGPPQPDLLPAQVIDPDGNLLWFLDEAAASQLEPLCQAGPPHTSVQERDQHDRKEVL